MYIRWMGAFGSGRSLVSSLIWEVAQAETKESACEKIKSNSTIHQSTVGLLCDPKKITKNFKGDCWSVPVKHRDGSVSLKKTRNPRVSSLHWESWVTGKDCFTGIVVKIPLGNLRNYVYRQVKMAAEATGLPVYYLKPGKKGKNAELIPQTL